MSGFAQGGVAIPSGSNLAIAGLQPSGVAAQNNVVWRPTPWKLLTSVLNNGGGTAAVTINTMGANLIVVVAITWPGFGMSDNQGNSWTQGISVVGGASAASTINYCINPNTSSTHSFTLQLGAYNSYVIHAFKGPTALSADQSSSTTTGTTAIQLPAISVSNESLIFTGITNNAVSNAGNTAISGNFILSGIGNYGAAAYLIQHSAASVSPIWTVPTSNGRGATMLSFKPA